MLHRCTFLAKTHIHGRNLGQQPNNAYQIEALSYIQQNSNNNSKELEKNLVLVKVEIDYEVHGTRKINRKFVPIIAALWFTVRKLVFIHTAAFGLTFARICVGSFLSSDLFCTVKHIRCNTPQLFTNPLVGPHARSGAVSSMLHEIAARRLRLQIIVLQRWHAENGWYNVPEDLLLHTSASRHFPKCCDPLDEVETRCQQLVYSKA